MADLLIGLDWGTSACRAYLMRRDGTVLETRAGDEGILAVPADGFDAVLAGKVGGWHASYGALPMIASGMIGSRQGWREAPYVACPAGPAELAAGLLPVDSGSGRLWLVPGVTCKSADGTPDVVRGEETQILGCGEGEATALRFFVLPGTHSKWMLVDGARIRHFLTFMTGEVFAVLTQHSILGRLMKGDALDSTAFKAGLARARRGGPLLHDLFSARTLGLFDILPDAGLHSYLSGLLIGSELAGEVEGPATEATIIAGSALARRYEEALAFFGIEARLAPADVAARGLARIAAAAGIVEA
jgi:2-dehydro-3-deoxygalactonokinase